MSTVQKPNYLIKESSPYLQQHAYNTVNWYPWGEEALLLAREENKPIFLSIGYSSCHWCHVMREESFEDEQVGKILNNFFISIKVDREERPDLDHIYMNFAQAMTGRGGWPLNVFLTPEQKPFYAMTYLPKESDGKEMGLIELLHRIHELWTNDEVRVQKSAEHLLKAVSETLDEKIQDTEDFDLQQKAFDELQVSFDETYGGFHQGQKFPLPHHLLFLLRYYHKTRNEKALSMVKKTLDTMYTGGIFDHLGYGFSRYTVDEKWQIPHFEKMLYDNALLLRVYAETYQVTKELLYKEVGEKIIDFIHREMTSDQGTFFSSLDADSEGEEGKFYTFTYNEIIDVLGEEAGQEFTQYYGVTKVGNFEGKNVLHLMGKPQGKMTKTLEESHEKMLSYRNQRVRPFTDDKILTSWNGLMIGGLAYAGMVFNEVKYVDRAKKALDNILNSQYRDEELYASSREGVLGSKGFLESYAYLIYGVLALQEVTLETKYLELAIELEKKMEIKFWDQESHGFFLRSTQESELIMKVKDIYDSALPSANAMAAYGLGKLWSLTGNRTYEKKLYQMMNAFKLKMNEQTLGFTGLLLSYAMYKEGPSEVVLLGSREEKGIQEMIQVVQSLYLPEYTVALQSEERKKEESEFYGLWRESLPEKPLAFVCRNHACLEEISDSHRLKDILSEK